MGANRASSRWADALVLRHRKGTFGQSGATLIELLLAVSLAAIISGPLVMGFMTMLRGSEATREEVDLSGDASRIGTYWTRDVQNVEIGGVNSGGVCSSPNPDAGQVETVLVSFSWNLISETGGNTGVRTSTWVAVGTGDELELVRRFCVGGIPESEAMIASKIGINGKDITEIIHGPNPSTPANPTASMDFCPLKNFGTEASPSLISDSCTIVIDGAIDYEIEVSRRVAERSTGVVVPVPPPPPTILVSATQARNTYITVGWTPPTLGAGQPPIDAYRVIVYNNPSGNSGIVASELVAGTNVVIDGLTNHTDYYVRVQSISGELTGALTPVFGPLTPRPTAPDAATITGTPVEGDGSITVTWTPGQNGGENITQWIIAAHPGSGAPITATITHGGGQTDSQSGTVSGLTNGAAYSVSVIGVNLIGEGLPSDSVGGLIPYGIPAVATNLVTTPLSDGTIQLDWTSPVFNGGRPITGLRVIMDNVLNGTAAGPWPSASTMFPAGTTSVVMSGFSLGGQYTFRVEVYNLRGHSTSAPSNPPILSSTLPGHPPSVSVAQSGSGSLTVSWGAAPPNGSPVTNYEISVSPVVSGSPRTVSGTTLSTTFTGLNSGTNYTFTVRARNINGWGSSNTGSAVASGNVNWAGHIPTVQRVSGNTYPFAYNISWNRPANTGGTCIATYIVQFSANNGSSVSSTQTLNGGAQNGGCTNEPARSLTWTGMAAGVHTRYFRVVAINALGSSAQAITGWQTIHHTQQCTVPAVADSFINPDNPWWGTDRRGQNYGNDSRLEVNKDGHRVYVKFDPRSNGSNCSEFAQALPASAVVSSGDVRLYNTDSTTFERRHTIAKVTADWGEHSITWNNRPGYTNDTAWQDASSNGWRTWWVNVGDIEEQRTGGRYGWTIRDTGGNILSGWSKYKSREDGTVGDRPHMRIQFY